jgi:hypothetical protein
MNDKIVKKAQDKQQVEQPFVKHQEKHYPTFEFLYLHLYYLQLYFCMIKCSFEVIDSLIFII